MKHMTMALVSLISGLLTILAVAWYVPNVARSQEIRHSTNNYIKFKNDSNRLKLEYRELGVVNSGLKDIIKDLSEYTSSNFNKPITITHIGRTDKEQEEIYPGENKTSPHQLNHAVDIRSWEFSGEEIEKIVNYLNAKHNPNNYYTTALYHDMGYGIHIHVQFYRE